MFKDCAYRYFDFAELTIREKALKLQSESGLCAQSYSPETFVYRLNNRIMFPSRKGGLWPVCFLRAHMGITGGFKASKEVTIR